VIKILVSSCLLGAPVRHDARDKKCDHAILQRWIEEGRVVSVCPEMLGGLGTPRPPSEIVNDGSRRVVTRDGVTIIGRLLNLDTFQVLMRDPKDQLRSFVKSDLREHGFVQASPMPSFRTTLSPQELADVIAYLGTLKGVVAQ